MQSSSSRTVSSSSRVVSSSGGSSMSAGMAGGSSMSSSTRRTVTMGAAAVAPGVSCQIAHSGVKNIVAGRTREKSDMQELNSRFSSYIETVRRLEAQNQQLAANLVSVRQTSGGETLAIKETYETELRQLRVVLDESERQKAELEVRITSLEDRVTDIHVLIDDHRDQDAVDRETIERLNRMITEYEREISMLRVRVTKFDEERTRDRLEVDRLRSEITRLRTDLDSETLIHIQTENECQTAREELEFTKQVLEAEVKELTSIAYRDTTVEVRDFWKGELAQAIQDLRMEYERRIEGSKVELETMYTSKVEEVSTTTVTTSSEVSYVREESERLKVEMTALREKMPALEERHVYLESQITTITRELEELRREQEMEKLTITNEVSETRYELSTVIEELKTLLDAKLSLELEIAAYRKLLEYEESRIVAAQSGYSSTTVISGGGGSSSMSMSASSGSAMQSSSSRMQMSSSGGSSSSTVTSTKTTVMRG